MRPRAHTCRLLLGASQVYIMRPSRFLCARAEESLGAGGALRSRRAECLSWYDGIRVPATLHITAIAPTGRGTPGGMRMGPLQWGSGRRLRVKEILSSTRRAANHVMPPSRRTIGTSGRSSL